jgi:hypothetical protein
MTASASWRGATLSACSSSLETATISPGASHWPPRRSLLCLRAHASIDGEAIVTDQNGLAVFDLIRGHRPSDAAVLCAFDLPRPPHSASRDRDSPQSSRWA